MEFALWGITCPILLLCSTDGFFCADGILTTAAAAAMLSEEIRESQKRGLMSKVEKIYKPALSRRNLPVFIAKISAGFPSPAADYEENKLDLNKHLVKNPAATFFVRVAGDSMTGAGIHDGDLLVVDRSLQPVSGNVVIAVLDGQLTVKRLRIKRGRITLEPENQNYPAHTIAKGMEFEVWGVVTNVIHPL